MPAAWNRCGFLSEKPALEMSLAEARTEVLRMRLRIVTLYGDIDRGRPLTSTEKLQNLKAALVEPQD